MSVKAAGVTDPDHSDMPTKNLDAVYEVDMDRVRQVLADSTR